MQVEQEAKESEGAADDDGWVTVTKKSSKPVVARTERAQKRLQAKEKKKREEKELLNFYTFQTRESKRERKYFEPQIYNIITLDCKVRAVPKV